MAKPYKNFKDEFTGKGGRYELRNGKRVRIEEPTKPAPEKTIEPKPSASEISTEKKEKKE